MANGQIHGVGLDRFSTHGGAAPGLAAARNERTNERLDKRAVRLALTCRRVDIAGNGLDSQRCRDPAAVPFWILPNPQLRARPECLLILEDHISIRVEERP